MAARPDAIARQGIGKLAEAGMRPGPEDLKAKDRDLPSELWDRVKTLPLPPAALEDLIKRMAGHRPQDHGSPGPCADAEKKIRDADDGIDRLKSDRITAEGEKHAADEERDRQQARLFAAADCSARFQTATSSQASRGLESEDRPLGRLESKALVPAPSARIPSLLPAAVPASVPAAVAWPSIEYRASA